MKRSRLTFFALFMLIGLGLVAVLSDEASSLLQRAAAKAVCLFRGKTLAVSYHLLPGTEIIQFPHEKLGQASDRGEFILNLPGQHNLLFKHPAGNTLLRPVDVYERCRPLRLDYVAEQTEDRSRHIYQKQVYNEQTRLSFEPRTLFIPEGQVTVGLPGMSPPNEIKQVRVPAFAISMYEISNKEFAEFVRDSGYLTDAEKDGGGYAADGRGRWAWVDSASWRQPFIDWSPEPGFWQWPVVMVSWQDAYEYCRWLSQKTNRHYRLPSEAEWERAARGDDGRVYPWGDEWEGGFDRYCNHGRTGARPEAGDDADGYLLLAPVDSFPEGRSPFGAYNMVGNAKEWVQDVFAKNQVEKRGHRTFRGTQRVLKGGGWYGDVNEWFLTAVARNGHNERLRFAGVGFRIVEEIASSRSPHD